MKAGWEIKPLGEVCDVIDPHPSHRAPNRVQEGIPFVGIGDFDEQGFLQIEKARIVPKEIHSEHQGRYSVHDDLLAIGRVASIGKVVRLPDTEDPYIISPTLAVLRPKNISRAYLFFALQGPDFQVLLNSLSKGSTRRSVGIMDLRIAEIPVPPLPEQERIVGILDEAFDGIAKAKALAEANLQNARTLFQSHLQSVFSQGGEGWVEKRLGDVCSIARGGSPRPIQKYITTEPSGINWVKIGDATASGKYIFNTQQKIIPEGVKRSRLVKDGDFLLSNSMSFGRPYIMKTTGCIHDGWLVLTDYSASLDQDYLYYILGSNLIYQQFDRLAAGSTVRNLNIDLASKVVIPIPSLKVQKNIVDKVENIAKETQRLESLYQSKLDALDELKKSLLHQAFSGNL